MGSRGRRAAVLSLLLAVALATPPLAVAASDPARPTPTPVAHLGTIRVVQGDPPRGSGQAHRVRYFLDTDDGRSGELFIDAQRARSMGGWLRMDGRRFTVQGTPRERGALDVTSLRAAGPAAAHSHDAAHHGSGSDHHHGPAVTSRAAAAATPDAGSAGSIRFATLLCRFSDSSGSPPKPKEYFEGLMGAAQPGMDHYWRAQSYGRIDLSTGSVAGWYRLPRPRSAYIPSGGEADLDLLLADCTRAADARGMDFSRVAGVNMAFDRPLDGAAWGGGATLALDGPRRAIGGVWIGSDNLTKQNYWAHEMGHAFGMPHSGTDYDNQWDSMSGGGDTCLLSVAGFSCVAPFTIMWHRDLPAHSNPLRSRLGTQWIPAARKHAYVMGSGRQEVQLGFSDTLAGTGRLMIRIPVSTRAESEVFYTVEARRRVSYDRALPGAGVLIHRVDTAETDPAQPIDANRNGDPNDAGSAWTVGRTFTDSANKVTVAVTAVTATGYTVVVTADRTAPTARAPIASIPAAPIRVDQAYLPVRIAWSGTDAGGSGVSRYELQESVNGGAFTRVALPSPLTSSVTRSLRRGTSYRYRVRVFDGTGNVSPFVAGAPFMPRAYQDGHTAVRYTGSPASTWAVGSGTTYAGGSVRSTRDGGQTATFRFVGRHVAFLTTRHAQAGKAEIWLDGTRVATPDLYSPTESSRHVVFARAVAPGVTHSLEVRVTGLANPSSQGSRVDVDAFLVLE